VRGVNCFICNTAVKNVKLCGNYFWKGCLTNYERMQKQNIEYNVVNVQYAFPCELLVFLCISCRVN